MPAPLLVPTDFSLAAAEALAYARRVARATGAAIHLMHVVSWPDAGPFEIPGDAPTASQEASEEDELARAALAAVAGDLDATLVVRRSNVPAFEICDYARRMGVGLVVMGVDGRGTAQSGISTRARVLGAVAADVVQTAGCDVLVVPHRDSDPFSHRPPRRVLVPVDFSTASRPLASFALDLAQRLGAGGVDLVHVLEPLPHPLRWLDEALVDALPQIHVRAQAALQELADHVVGSGASPVHLGLYVERGKAARTIVRVAQALGDDLIVIGPHDERPVFDAMLGSVAEGVVRRAACPVLIARRSGAPGPFDDEVVDARSYRSDVAPV